MSTDPRRELLERSPPHSVEAERAILGSLLLDNSLLSEATVELRSDDFYVRAHQLVFTAMLHLYSTGGEIDPLLLSEELRREGVLEQVGGMDLISGLTFGLPHYANIAAYTKIVKAKKLRRDTIKAANKIHSDAYEEEDVSDDELIDRAGKYIFELSDRRQTKKMIRVDALVKSNLERAAERKERGNLVTGLATGLRELDAMLLGLQPTDLVIIAARPGVGKTSAGLTIAQNASLQSGAVVGFFSLEMSEEQLGDRLLCSEARVDSMKFRSGYLNRDEWSRVAGCIETYEGGRLFIDDTPAITPLYLRSRARRLAMEQGRLDLIVADYLQLFRPTEKRRSREEEVSSISGELKAIAKELKVPLVAMSQLNRSSEQRSNHRPQLSDLRESGSIEQDADVVALIHREELYQPTDENAGIAEVIIAKNRAGPTGTIRLAWLKEFTRFENMWDDR